MIFIGLSETKIGAMRRATPNIKKIFGYDLAEVNLLNVRQLMPMVFAEKHD